MSKSLARKFADIARKADYFTNVEEDVNASYDDRSIVSLGAVSGTTNINLGLGTNVTATIAGATTFTVSGLSSGKVNTVTLRLTNPGAYSITWPSGTTFNLNAAPTLPASGNTMIVLESFDNGATWAGIQVWRDIA